MNETLARAERGDAEAQFGLGLKFANGGAEEDWPRAVLWYRRAADQQHALAQFNLAKMYAQGQGVTRDLAEADRWNQRAAGLGDAGALFTLGVACHRTSIGPGDKCAEARIEAFKWYTLAAAQGYLGSERACECLRLEMTWEQVAEGHRRAALFACQHRGLDAQDVFRLPPNPDGLSHC